MNQTELNPTAALAAIHAACGDGECLSVLGTRTTIKVEGAHTGGAFSLVGIDVAPGAGTPPHIHTREDETFYVVDGELTINAAGKVIVARAGDVVFSPRNVPHNFVNTGGGAARVLVLITPAGFEAFFREIGLPWTTESVLGAEPTAAELQNLAVLSPKYGMEILQ